MPRPPRFQFAGAFYHVFNRGNRRERIFVSNEDFQAFESYLLETMTRSRIELYNWSQLPNHFHFNLATPDGNLGEFMQRLLTRYAKYFNRTYRLVGHLFQSRYSAKLIDRDVYFKEIIRYVELNPYRTKGRLLADLGKWRWSSLHYLMKPASAWPEGCQTAFRRVLETFGADPSAARERLLRFLADGLKMGTWEKFYQPKEGRFLGDEPFVERSKALQREPVRKIPRLLRRAVDINLLFNVAERVGGYKRAQLRAPGRSRGISRWRQSIVFIARRYFRIPVIRLARELDRRESTISMIVARAAPNMEQRPEARRLLAALSRRCRVKCDM
jgi:putative transposase